MVHSIFNRFFAHARKRISLDDYIALYLSQISSGARQTDRGSNYSPATVKSVRYSLGRFTAFQREVRREYDFRHIDMAFYYEYTAFLKRKGLSINSVGKCIRDLKVILRAAEDDGIRVSPEWKERRFKGTRIEVDSIYLTPNDLKRIRAVNCAALGPRHELARDIFLVGVWTAQRISDYNHIRREDIKTLLCTSASGEPEQITYLDIRQKKTGAKVSIPCNSDLRAILEKYSYCMPYLPDKVINRCIKEIAHAAGLTKPVEIETTKGGTPRKEWIPKWQLVHSHTARRTGATLMYLAGVDLYDIMKITGHTTPAMLKKYIKADSLEVVEKLAGKYDYFR